jgi:hypothetical protein
MKALTVCQPYAEMIVRGVKPIENRTWPTGYRGELLIHAGKSQAWLDPDDIATYPTMKFGAVVGVAQLVACLNLEHPATWPAAYQHLATHKHANGPWCWVLENVRPLTEPLECRGAQGPWLPPTWLVARVQGMRLERVA